MGEKNEHKTCHKCYLGTTSNGGMNPKCHPINYAWKTCSHVACAVSKSAQSCRLHTSANALKDLAKGKAVTQKSCTKSKTSSKRINIFHHCQHLTKYVKKCMNLAAGAWHKTIAGKLENACVVLISQPEASNCRDYCIKRGGHCVRAQDNKGDTCNLDNAHHRQSTANNGCNQVWYNQVCACGRGKVSSNGGGDSAKYTSSEGNNVNRNGYLKL